MEHPNYLPFTSRAAWLSTQSECSDLRRTATHLCDKLAYQKITNLRDVEKYLNVAKISKMAISRKTEHSILTI